MILIYDILDTVDHASDFKNSQVGKKDYRRRGIDEGITSVYILTPTSCVLESAGLSYTFWFDTESQADVFFEAACARVGNTFNVRGGLGIYSLNIKPK